MNRSPATINQYRMDLMLFIKYQIAKRNKLPLSGDEFNSISIENADIRFFREITSNDIYDFMLFVTNERGNSAGARARKLSALKVFYKYLVFVTKETDYNPTEAISAPTVKQRLPKYLTLDESLVLLDTVRADEANPHRIRDFAIITLFLNCGMRLAELCGISLHDIDPKLQSMRVVGKGSKERIVYLNAACREALSEYLELRKGMQDIKDKNALFVSRLGKRISNKTVQYIVYRYLEQSGLGYRKLSVHKLRHTAATLMYQSGKVDVRVLKDILGHEQLNTTQIYTHVSDAQMQNAMENNPLSREKKGKK
ncbi:MAG: tyrosine recombinase XerC [Ruminococcaceae bacterium]|nr:tyrosine recombinase XerC [Oscillospiraceae bacterium]